MRGSVGQKPLGHGVADDPYNSVVAIDNKRQQVAVGTRNFAIHQKVLQFSRPPPEAGRVKTIPRLARPDRERPVETGDEGRQPLRRC